MKYQKIIRTAVCAVSAGAAVCLAGCSISFCGMQPGGKEELVFSCGEHPAKAEEPVAENESLSPENGQEEPPFSGQPEEPEASSAPSEESKTEQASETSGNEALSADGRVNINSAGVEELMTLNGIGETRAKAIVEYRTQNGTFTKAEDIMQVPGIKEGIYSKIQSQIAVD